MNKKIRDFLSLLIWVACVACSSPSAHPDETIAEALEASAPPAAPVMTAPAPLMTSGAPSSSAGGSSCPAGYSNFGQASGCFDIDPCWVGSPAGQWCGSFPSYFSTGDTTDPATVTCPACPIGSSCGGWMNGVAGIGAYPNWCFRSCTAAQIAAGAAVPAASNTGALWGQGSLICGHSL